MPNRYANLNGASNISSEYTKINTGFDAVQAEMDEQTTIIEALQSGDSGAAANAARVSTPYATTYPTLKDRCDHTDEELLSHLADEATNLVLGHVKVDNETIRASSGVISAMFKGPSGKTYALVSGVIRYTNALGWYVLDDVDHTPIGINNVEVVGDSVRINYDFTASNVVSLIITPDDTLAAKGYTISGSGVGLGATDFKFARLVDIYGRAAYSGSAWSLMNHNSAEYNITTTNLGGGILRISHTSDDVGMLPIMLTGFLDSHYPQVYNFDTTYFDVAFYDRATGARVTTFDTNCKFMFRRGGYTMPAVSSGYPYEGGNFFVIGVMEV